MKKKILTLFIFTLSIEKPLLSDIWYSSYVEGKKIGYSREKNYIKNRKQIKEFYTEMMVKLMGEEKRVVVKGRVIRENSTLKYAESELLGDSPLKVLSDFQKGKILVRKITPFSSDEITLELHPPLPLYLPQTMEELYGEMIEGDVREREIEIYDPSTAQLVKGRVRKEGKKKMLLREKEMAGFFFSIKTDFFSSETFTDEKGRILYEREESGIETFLTDENEAMRISGLPLDFTVHFAIPLEGNIDPKKAKEVKYEITGAVFEEGELSGFRQDFSKNILKIKVEGFPSHSYRIPYEGEEHKIYLRKDFLINPELKELKELAGKIAGKERDACKVFKKIINWVNANIEKEPVVSIPDPLSILKTKKGDCNEHAVLAVSLLRSLGIPSRVAVGVVFSAGYFYYHAWVEAYVGEWISGDPVMNQIPADASHIRFASDGMEEWSKIMKLVGRVKIKILEAQ